MPARPDLHLGLTPLPWEALLPPRAPSPCWAHGGPLAEPVVNLLAMG